MQQELRNRSVKIVTKDGVGVGTGILIDSQHILTCVHVVRDALVGTNVVTEQTPVYFLHIQNTDKEKTSKDSSNKKQLAYIVHSFFKVEDIGQLVHFEFPKFPRFFEDAEAEDFDYTQDLILLKTQASMLNCSLPIYWKEKPQDSDIAVEGYGYHYVAGRTFTANLEAKCIYGIYEYILHEKIPEDAEGLSGASGTGVFGVTNLILNEIIGYGIVVTESKIESENERVYLVSGSDILQFLSTYPDYLSEWCLTSSSHIQTDSSTQHELAISLLDREFIADVRRKLVKNRLACITLTAKNGEWFDAVRMRFAQVLEIQEELDNVGLVGDALPFFVTEKYIQISSAQFMWRNKTKSNDSRDILELIIKRIPNIKGTKSKVLPAKDSENVDIWQYFHSCISNLHRLVICIDLESPFLSRQHQRVLKDLVDGLKAHVSSSSSQVKTTEILLCLINKENKANMWSRVKYFLTGYEHVETTTKKINGWTEHRATLESIDYDHVCEWQALLRESEQFDTLYANRLIREINRLVSATSNISHQELRESLIRKIDQSGS